VSRDEWQRPPDGSSLRVRQPGVTVGVAALEKSVALSILKINPADYWLLYDTLPTTRGASDLGS